VKNLWKLQVLLALFLVGLSMVFPAGASATIIYPTNYSFEDPVLAINSYTSTTPGWTKTGAGGGIDDYGWAYPSIPNGVNYAFLANGTLSQVLTQTVQANHKYTLDVYVGRYYTTTPTYTVKLVARDGGGVDHVLAQTPASLAAYRVFNLVELSYTALAGDPYLGDHLKIILSSTGQENNFDDVTIKDLSVPAPPTLLLLSSGLVGLAFMRLRRKARK
jgi:hypothetical protein